ncbi:MAG: septum formation protein Maf [Salinivirgaceae bacterium]|nr:septum formation protein Maf [Salinivirgaceae bacterium]
MIFKNNYKIILASNSPRRQNLLRELELDFEIKTKNIEEKYPPELVKEEIPLYLSKLKAEAFGILDDHELLITADTIVWVNNHILEKPIDAKDALRMLEILSDNKHTVYTGVCLKTNNKQKTFWASTDVYFRKLEKEEIEFYVHKYKPFDKAGSYGIQEWIGYIGIEKINGSYFNVMGLPIQKLYDELKKF